MNDIANLSMDYYAWAFCREKPSVSVDKGALFLYRTSDSSLNGCAYKGLPYYLDEKEENVK